VAAAAPPSTRRRTLGGGALLAGAALAGCAAPSGGAAGTTLQVLVANGADGTVTRLDARTGRPVGAPVPAGPAPAQAIAGPAGHLLVLSAATGARAVLTHVAATGAGWVARPLTLEPGATVLQMAGDGGRYAAVIYRRRPEGPAAALPQRVALVDLLDGAVALTHPVGAPGDSVTALAVENGSAGPAVYAGTWSPPRLAGGRWVPAAGRLLAVDAHSGAAAVHAVTGVPGQVMLGPAPRRARRRLYVVEAVGGAGDGPSGDAALLYATARAWRLVGLNPVTLEVESEQAVPYALYWLTLAPDGDHAYALPGPGTGLAAGRLLRIDLAAGGATLLDRTPAPTVGGLAVTDTRIFLPDVAHDQVWALDRRGRPLGAVRVGRGPLGIGLSRQP
jgi:hypothetical protein